VPDDWLAVSSIRPSLRFAHMVTTSPPPSW
jgi:hypothetical protein